MFEIFLPIKIDIFVFFNFFSFADDHDDDEVKNMRILYAQQCENIYFQFMTSEK